ncbi:MAG: DUF2232 domain-containing protein [Clostridia bacterium]|nr:DUF2232 domain-containing protein [Clostridia bacterium]
MVDVILIIVSLAGLFFSAFYTFKNKISFFKGICLGTLSLLGAFVLSVIYQKAVLGISPIDIIIKATFDSMKQLIDETPADMLNSFALAMGETNSEVVRATFKLFVESMRQIYTILLPSFLITIFAGFTFILFMIVKNVLRLMKKDVSFITNFNSIRLNRSFVLVYFLIFLAGTVVPDGTIGNVVSNVFFVMSVYVYFCTLSLVDYFLQKRIRIFAIRFIILVLFVMTMSMAFGIAALFAVIDAFRNFRARGERL